MRWRRRLCRWQDKNIDHGDTESSFRILSAQSPLLESRICISLCLCASMVK